MGLGECCRSGVRHEGNPEGKEEVIGGVNTYVALPKGDYDKTKALLFLTDIFGLPLTNNKLLADDFAASGVAVYMPDYLNGDACPADALVPGSKFDLGEWFSRHGQDVTRPPLDKVIAALKEQGVTKFAATGHCLGGRYVADLTFDQQIAAGLYHHPSLLEPADLEKLATFATPSLWNCCEHDDMFPKAKQDALKKAFEGKQGFEYHYFEGASHGFSVRGDMSKPEVKAAKEGAFNNSVKFLNSNF